MLLAHFIFTTLIGFANANTVQFEGRVKIKRPSESGFIEVKEGESIKTEKGQTLLIVSEKGWPVIFHQPASEKSTLTITESDLNSLYQERVKKTLDENVSEVLEGLRKSEGYIQSKNYEEAKKTLTKMKEKFPHLSQIHFMSGTVHYLLSEKALAIESLEQGLSINPKDASAQKLLQQIRGRQ